MKALIFISYLLLPLCQKPLKQLKLCEAIEKFIKECLVKCIQEWWGTLDLWVPIESEKGARCIVVNIFLRIK